MDRRAILKLGAGFSAAVLLARQVLSAGGAAASEVMALDKLPLAASTPFADDTVIEQARLLAKSPYVAPGTFPKATRTSITTAIARFGSRKVWRFGAGRISATLRSCSAPATSTRLRCIFVVDGGQAAEIAYDPDIFTCGPEVSRPPEGSRPGFSGLRIHAPIDKASVMDEFAVFQGASYFRAKAAGQGYGMSGRGLAINTTQPPADEFPIFRSYWLQRPAPGSPTVTVFALLDSVSVSGAYKFVISAGTDTIMDVECTLFPRTAMPYAGIAPLTSMFYFAPGGRYLADEARFRVHDSDGLAILNAKGERIWRPLINPKRVQYSSFSEAAEGLRPSAARAPGGPLPGYRCPLRIAPERLGGTQGELGGWLGRPG